MGMVPVSTTSASMNVDGGTLAVNNYALTVGTGGDDPLTATYVATFSSKPASVTISGTVAAATAYGIEISTTQYGVVPIMLSSATTGSYTVGSTVTVVGTGAANAAVLATSLTSGAPASTATPKATATPVATAAPTAPAVTGVPKHLLTAEYLGTPYGTTSVSPATASAYLNYAITSPVNGNAIHAAGIEVETYMNPNRIQTTDPLYSMLNSTAFAQTCSGTRVYDVYAGIDQYIGNITSSDLQTEYAALVAKDIAGEHVDYIWEDNAGPLGYDNTLHPSAPCDYTDASWIAGEEAMEAKLPIPTIANTLSVFNESAIAPGTTAVINGSKTAGGNYEDCFANSAANSSGTYNQGSWPWQYAEQEQINVTAAKKVFQCMARDGVAASSSIPARIYTLASFLMTYNQSYSVFEEEFATPSGLRVMPESQFVPTQPVVSSVSNIATLEKGTDTYVREYKACYYKGSLVGPCAMVVNMAYGSEPTPAFTQTYHHTLSLSGNGILDGGSVSFTGSAPPSSMAAESAFIALP
jgi:hypothetical protein